jgi:hypothetical protein
MICSIINEGTAPRYAPEGSQPTSNPVAPKQVPAEDTSLAPATRDLKLRSFSVAATIPTGNEFR